MSEVKKRNLSKEIYSLSLYFKEINKIPLLSLQEELDCARRAAKGDPKAKERLFNANLRFVVKVAKKYQYRGLPLEDLISEGNIGLMKAIDRFDSTKGFRFISYAVWWIKQAVMSAVREKARMIRLPRGVAVKLEKLDGARHDLRRETGKQPDLDQLSQRLRMPMHQISELLNISRQTISLEDQAYKDSEWEIADFIADKVTRSPADQIIDSSLVAVINETLKKLPDREVKILEMRFGLNGNQRMSLQQVADVFNITKERIRQLEMKAVRKVRQARSHYLRDYIS